MIEQLDIEAWQAFDALHPAPTFFARPAWALAIQHAYPGMRACPVRIGLRDGGRLIVPLVLAPGGKLQWREFLGMPLGAYTCALRDDGTPATTSEFSEGVEAIRHACDTFVCTPWPLAPRPVVRSGCTERVHETSVIDLADGLENALRGLDGVSRRMAGQAQRRGVQCAPSRSAMAASTYYEMLRIAAERWGIGQPHFPKALLDGLLINGGGNVEIWFAEQDGHPIAGGVVLYGSQELFFWSAAMRPEYSRLRPSNALNVSLIAAACERGVRWYNLGASEGLAGVSRFKRGLGATELPYSELQYARPSYSVYSWLRTSVFDSRPTPAGGGA
jgi:CelD/BcsL family acetyltransferase involved in cellulose biosynthesis